MAYKPTEVIEVSCWGNKVGALAFDAATGVYAFEYFKAFRRLGLELAPLTLPAATDHAVGFPNLPPATYFGLPAFIADCIPDDFGNALVASWMAAQGVAHADITSLDRLAYTGKRAMGALEFKPSLRVEAPKPSALQMGELVAEARRAMQFDLNAASSDAEDEQNELAQLIAVGTSAGGARAKAVVGYNDKTGMFVSGQFDVPEGYEHWLIKFDVGQTQDPGATSQYGRTEYAYYLMARACGIEMMPCKLYDAAGATHFMTKRFDRVVDGTGKHTKLHQQTLCAMAELDYKQRGVHDYSQLFMTIEALDLGFAAVDQAFLRMVFNVCAANNDDHTKNHSFIMEPNGDWSLAPAYDLTHAYRADSLWVSQHLMSVNKKFENINRADLLEVGSRFGVSAPQKQIDFVREVVGHWLDFAKEAGVDAMQTAKIKKDIAHFSEMLCC